MITFSTYKRVRYGETDQMGYLYYGNYASYYEIGRAETFRSLGLIYKDMSAGKRARKKLYATELARVIISSLCISLPIKTNTSKSGIPLNPANEVVLANRRDLLTNGRDKIFRSCFIRSFLIKVFGYFFIPGCGCVDSFPRLRINVT